MFAVVKVTEKEKGFMSRLRKNRITAERILLPNGEFFFVITAEMTKDVFPFEEIIHFSDKMKNCLIFENDAPVSYDRFKPALLKKKLLFLYAERFIQKAEYNPSETSLCLCDGEGLHCDELHRLFPFASKLHVVSPNKAYIDKAHELLMEYGVSVTVSECFDKRAEKSSIIVCHSSDMISVGFKGTVITNEPRIFPFARCVTDDNILLPSHYESLMPEKIDRDIFASALYEKCLCEDILQWCAERI